MDFPLELFFFKTSVVELIAVSFGLVSVWCMMKENILAYPFGIVNVLIYAYICFSTRLYAYSSINVFYAVMSGYGWFMWSHQDPEAGKLKITKLSPKSLILNLSFMVVSYIILNILLVKLTDSVVPFWDAITTAIYIIAMWLLARKKVENWIAWIIGDVISIGLFAYEKLYFSSFQFLVFTIIAVFGFLEWRKKLVKD